MQTEWQVQVSTHSMVNQIQGILVRVQRFVVLLSISVIYRFEMLGNSVKVDKFKNHLTSYAHNPVTGIYFLYVIFAKIEAVTTL